MTQPRLDTFRLRPGDTIADKYEVISKLGKGWESEVYLVRERRTGIPRAAKLFFPQRNERNRAVRFHARKLHRLRDCPIVIQYHTQEHFDFKGTPITLLISEFVEGERLSRFLKRQPGGRLTPFQAIHLLHALAKGIECIHERGEYHGDLHTDNVIVKSFGLGFELRLFDMFRWKGTVVENIQEDVVNLIRIFHESLGGRKFYARQPPEVKAICCGLKRTLILRKFKTAGRLRAYLEAMIWR